MVCYHVSATCRVLPWAHKNKGAVGGSGKVKQWLNATKDTNARSLLCGDFKKNLSAFIVLIPLFPQTISNAKTCNVFCTYNKQCH